MAAQRDRAWAGIDVGKRHHWVCAVDADGTRLLSVKIANDEAEIRALVATVGELARQVTWAVDIIGAPSALQPVLGVRGMVDRLQFRPLRFVSGSRAASLPAIAAARASEIE